MYFVSFGIGLLLMFILAFIIWGAIDFAKEMRELKGLEKRKQDDIDH